MQNELVKIIEHWAEDEDIDCNDEQIAILVDHISFAMEMGYIPRLL